MRYNKMKNITDIVEKSPLAEIARRSLLLGDLNRTLQQCFPPEFKGRFRVANIRDEVLYCEVQNATLRQGILFRQAELLALVQQAFPAVKRLVFNINPELMVL
ncbi:DUF721 domain-containing protein [Testudinibacter sp. TR-2022]|uniref:DciA family protein n=1 Tax=Testudinibacter sp. TR-2022 TaxID=2585029 RepID=UPI0011191FE2|nr:DciA family protein [Testudinibacter sp. TR-2022]TNH04021.1 DUF721 domain-containing protein [Pasteurellaceae bacterium Phil31]TNH08791.1 DUF721 domain-containing protein [Testudinibacter sp. TR-2022]TNH11425.1 DUF721 domain-containing protein [Testudinibacter sp. TR-2022]TNH11467.1 DUF721 domain-containing protein [Testudinibacter sp. TR-2022]TNH17428.1 DUF721 domain-containing protein [Testudinibacter sp. TR-2022]